MKGVKDMITIEQVEKIRERANVSYEDARAALEATDGDMLEAMIHLEKQGKIPGPKTSSYNTATGATYNEAGRDDWDAHQGYGNGRRGQRGGAGYDYDDECYDHHGRRRSPFRQ
jgi:hypothetical protein